MNKPKEAMEHVLSANLRRFLYLTAATTGAVILIVEILGAKMLSPYVGTSHFVWTAQITVTLISLACGYYFGGWLVDRKPELKYIYFCILGAALYLALTIGLCKPVAYACLKFKLATGSILASLFLFFVPLTLLAAVGPFMIRILTRSVNVVGSQVGRLSAISTLGSVIGTLLIGYVLIPFMANSVTMYLTAALLLVLVAAYFVIWGRGKSQKTPATLAAIALFAGFFGVRADLQYESDGTILLHRSNSDFGMLQVIDSKTTGYRDYLNDYLTQNTYDPATRKSVNLFTYMLHGLSHAYVTKLDNALCIGLGVGVVPMQFVEEGINVDVVEINPDIVPVAEKYFDLEPDRMNIVIDDGRHFLHVADTKYDVIVLDAFLGESSPSHLMTVEAFEEMAAAMTPDGVLVINSFGYFLPGKDFFVASLHNTLKEAFKHVRIHHRGSGNVFFVASDREELDMLRRPSLEHVHERQRSAVEETFRGLGSVNSVSGMILTDDYNPVDFYDAVNREEIRRQLATHMRGR